MASRPRHTDPHVEKAIDAAERRGWRVEKATGGRAHVWGRMLCPQSTREGCVVFIHGTPRNPQSHARHIRNRVDGCPHQGNHEPGAMP
jgi:hypothetical protein